MNWKLIPAPQRMAIILCALTLAPKLVSAQMKIGENPTQKVSGARLQVDGDTSIATPAKLIVTGTGKIGIGTAAPGTTLDVNGAITNRETAVAVAANAATIPANTSQVQLTGAATANVTITGPTSPGTGQRLIIYNNTTGGFPTTLNGFAIPVGQSMEFAYSNGNWRATNGGATVNNWGIAGNAATAPATNFIGTTDNVDFVTRTNNTERMRVSNTGNVGIGTTTPGQTLSVSDASTGTVATTSILQPNLGANNRTFIKFGRALSTNDAADLSFTNAGTGSTNNAFNLGFHGAGFVATFRADGNVGLGTVAPAQRLHVAGAARITGNAGIATGIMGRDANGDISNLALGTGLTLTNGTLSGTSTNIYNTDGTLTGNRTVTQGANTLAFNGTAVNAFSVDGTTFSVDAANNRVGIGTATPNAELQLSNNTNNRKIVLFEAANNANQYYGFGLNGGELRYQVDNTVASHIFYAAASATASNELMRISGLGMVGIGTASPDQTLSVNGNASKSQGGTAWAVFSDKRLKKDIHAFTDGLQQVLQIKPVFFKYNGKGGLNPSAKDEIGIIAQEMQQIAPYAVTQTDRQIDDSGKGALQFDRAEAVTYMLVNAVKEQQAMIEKQQQLIDKLNEQNTRLTAEVEVIKKEVSNGKYSVK